MDQKKLENTESKSYTHTPKNRNSSKTDNIEFLNVKKKKELSCSYQLVVHKDQGMTRSQNLQCAYRNLAHISLCFITIRQTPNSSEFLCSSNENEFNIKKIKQAYT